MEEVILHVVRLDTLLWILGGFSEGPVDAPYTKALPEALWLEIDKLAAMKRSPYGSVLSLAERWGKSVAVMNCHVMVARRGYRAPYRAGPPSPSGSVRRYRAAARPSSRPAPAE